MHHLGPRERRSCVPFSRRFVIPPQKGTWKGHGGSLSKQTPQHCHTVNPFPCDLKMPKPSFKLLNLLTLWNQDLLEDKCSHFLDLQLSSKPLHPHNRKECNRGLTDASFLEFPSARKPQPNPFVQLAERSQKVIELFRQTTNSQS